MSPLCLGILLHLKMGIRSEALHTMSSKLRASGSLILQNLGDRCVPEVI